MAATYPPGPAPRTRTSKSLTRDRLQRVARLDHRWLACRNPPDDVAGWTHADPHRRGVRVPGYPLRQRFERAGHDVTALIRHHPGPRRPVGTRTRRSTRSWSTTPTSWSTSPARRCWATRTQKHARRLLESRVAHDARAGRGDRCERPQACLPRRERDSFYGDHGAEPVTEDAESRGSAFLTRVTRDWQAATEPASAAGARTCVLRTAPVFGPGSMVTAALRRLFRLGLGGRLGSGRQYFPLVSAQDWVEAVARMASRRNHQRTGEPGGARPPDQRGVDPDARAAAAPADRAPGAGSRHPARGRSDGPRAARLGPRAPAGAPRPGFPVRPSRR